MEGGEGSGKSTQAALLAARLDAVLTREPGGTATGERIRALLLDPGLPPVDVRTETLLLLAARAQHVAEVIRPAVEAGRDVVCDRFSGSTLAYQGWGRGLAIEPLRAVVEWAAAGRQPDLTVLVDVPLEVARARLATSSPDRLEGLDEAFHRRVREGFLSQAESNPDGWVVVDGTPASEAVAGHILEAVTRRFPDAPTGRTVGS